MTICKYKVGPGRNCGSFAFNLHKDEIDQGDLCDVHYWEQQCQAQATEIERLRRALQSMTRTEPCGCGCDGVKAILLRPSRYYLIAKEALKGEKS